MSRARDPSIKKAETLQEKMRSSTINLFEGLRHASEGLDKTYQSAMEFCGKTRKNIKLMREELGEMKQHVQDSVDENNEVGLEFFGISFRIFES